MILGIRGGAKELRSAIGIALLGLVVLCLPADRASAQVPNGCPGSLASADIIEHDLNVSFCELCDVGDVRIVVQNPFGRSSSVGSFTDLRITEDLGASGLVYVPGSTRFSGNNISVPPNEEPVPPSGSVFTWDLSGDLTMDPISGPRDATLIIDFQVTRPPTSQEGLVSANRDITASVELTPECSLDGSTFTASTGPEELPLREPEPAIIKSGRNLDAGQGPNQYSNPVYGHEDDDVIWRIQVRNDGDAPLQDFRFDDTMAPGNFRIDWVCDSEGTAVNASNGSPAGCVPPDTPLSIDDFDVAGAFGSGPGPYIVAPARGSGFYYLVGEVISSCDNATNTVSDAAWGCESDPGGPGDIQAPSSGGPVPPAAAELSTISDPDGVDVDVFLEGVNLSQPMGARGTVTIRIRNQSGGTIKSDSAIRVRNVLPEEYVIDTTAPIQLLRNPAYGTDYDGFVDTVQWLNPAANTYPTMTSTNEAEPLSNADLVFLLTSGEGQDGDPAKVNMIRHGDTVRIRFRTVLVDPPDYYDRVADLDVRQEDANSDPPGTDPQQSFDIDTHTEIDFQEFCSNTTTHHREFDDSDTANPEDLDIDISGNELVFILTNTGDPLPLTVELTNRGGHDADNYQAWVTFGEAMQVSSAPGYCTDVSAAGTDPFVVWQIPTGLPSTASIYLCDPGVVAPGQTVFMNFEVVKNTAASFDDDLTFRADVIGEIWLSDDVPQPDGSTGPQLWFPAPVARPDGVLDRANDYSIDAVWARVVGYNLFKTQLGTCTENNPPPGVPDDQIQIGEECSFHVESGGWFGFRTPGFQYIAVQDVQVVDDLPEGQGYISSTDPLLQSTSAILGVSLNPPPTVLDDADFDWTFNTLVPDERITEKDHWFRADVTTRMLNDPIDTSAPPNEHDALSSNVLTSTFQAVFFNDSTMMEEVFDLGPNTVGYPREVYRRIDLTVTEPHLVVEKQVCNETIYGPGESCTNFVDRADDGDAFDSYVFRIRITNEAEPGDVAPRAPAYDVTVTSVADASDKLFVQPLAGDTVDNDGDDDVDAGDTDGEGTITDNVIANAVPAQIIASYTHSDELLRIDPGEVVELFYRVDPDDDVAPLQLFTNTVTATYDSLEGPSGAQTPPQGADGEIGGQRRYQSAPADAEIQIIPVETQPKRITALSNTAISAPISPQPVSIGEEIEFDLHALIPVAQLRSFVIRDVLPTGLRCAEAPDVDLDAAPYSDAGFDPGGVITPSCTASEVVWDFGDQTVTMSDRTDRRFDLGIQFIARVDNEAGNQDGSVIRNGNAPSITEVRYIDEADNLVVIPIGESAVVVQEPLLALDKTFSVAQVDAADVPQVTVTARNDGTAPAYNLRVLDDLSLVELSYAGGITGANPPTADLTTFGPDSPLFTWPGGISIAPGESLSFSFGVSVDGTAEPLEVLPNTVQADWTSLPGQDTALNSTGLIGPDGDATGMRNGALPNDPADTLNDYEAEASADVSIPPVTIEKLDVDPALVPEIGAHKPFEVVISLPEGTTQGLVASDDLASGAVSYVLADNADFDVVYTFEGIASINGQPPSEAALTAVPADGTSGTAVWDIGTVVTDSEDDLTENLVNPTIRIAYHGRINNDLDTDVGDTLQNGLLVNYTNGDDGSLEALNDDTPATTAIESHLTATKALTNVTPGKGAADPPALGDVLQYVVTIPNDGNATAYDVQVVDTLPPEVQLYGGFTPTALVGGSPVAGFVATPSGAPAGPLVWGRQNADESLDIPAGESLVLTYQVTVTAVLNGTTIANEIVGDWTSLESVSVYERTGDGCGVSTSPDDYCFGPAVAVGTSDPLPPVELTKVNTQAQASIGEPFTYVITVPSAAYPYDLHDVRILDDLTASGVDLRFLGVRSLGSESWTPVNTGSPTNLVIEDTGQGIDIPHDTQIMLEITVVLEDTPDNNAGDTFNNTASFLWNVVDNDIATELTGGGPPTADMTIVEPDLTLTKDGPATMTVGTPETFTLTVENAGDGPAWNTTVTDLLPDTPAGGTCGTTPANVAAEIFDAGGASVAVLTADTDYTTSFSACLLGLTILTDLGTIEPGGRLVVSYDLQLDADTQDAAMLTNYAGAVEWFSWADTSPDRRTYSEVVTDGSPGTLDFQDLHTLNVTLPTLLFEKRVINVTTNQDPATSASPGDTLRYELYVENTSDVSVNDFALVDDLGSLNSPPVYQPNTLVLDPLPQGTDSSSATGGTNGTGLIDVQGLSLPNNGDNVTIAFQVDLAPVIANGTLVTNQTELQIDGNTFDLSDDPNVGGAEDPTVVPIRSAPAFVVEKISTDLSGDPNVLLAGETLEYTITVVNIGTDDAIDVSLRDAVPSNTSYVPGSTTLNGNPVPDGAGGLAPLAAGILINAPSAPAGSLPADPSAAATSTATITFQVVVDPSAPDGTIISNQGFVTSVPGGVVDDPSDDPNTPVPDDPTRDIVGDLPLLFAAKDVVLIDNGTTPGVVEPGDTLQYTITITNSGAVPATNVVLTDALPANTTYDPGTTTLNSEAVPDGPGSSLPLILGLPVSSDDLTPPIPGPGAGTINPLQTATIVYELLVAGSATPGTIISNQATVTSIEAPNLLTDGDGNPSTGPEPTVVVVGDVQTLTITKQVSVVGGGPVMSGSTLEYVVQVRNISTLDAVGVVISDDLDDPVGSQLSYVPTSGTMNGSPMGVSDSGSVITADYSSLNGPLPPGGTIVLRFQAVVATLPIGTPVTNVATVTWNTNQMATASVTVDVGGMPGVGMLNGRVWHDADFDDLFDAGEPELAAWSVQLFRNGGLVQSVTTAADGTWSIGGLAPNDLSGDLYEVRFSAPGSGANTATLGTASSIFTNGRHQITDIVFASGANLQNLDLPIEPNGVVYDALLRAPVPGAALTLLDAGSGMPVSSSCFDDAVQQGQVTTANGYYKFDLNFGGAGCADPGDYLIAVAPPGAGFSVGASQIIPPTTDATTTPYSVPICPADAVGATSECEASSPPLMPSPMDPPGSSATTYYLHLSFDSGQRPETSQIFNNHIALDPVLNGAVGITKTTPSVNVSRGQLVPYEISVINSLGVEIADLGVVDHFPFGFRYVDGSARVDGVPLEPKVNGQELAWDNVGVPAAGKRKIVLLLAVGAGVSDGEYVNRARAVSTATGTPLSGEAFATVRVVPDPTFSCTDVMGKVFDDANRNGLQDPGERGLQGVRISTLRGLVATTDAYGRYHFTCAALPNEFRGSNFALKIDDRTLPTGYRMLGRETLVKRATRGKALRFNFPATIHRVVSLDLADPVFEPGSTTMRAQWEPRLGVLLDELKKAPSVLRLSYVADVEAEGLVEQRLETIKERITEAWKALGDGYALTIEPEVFWRRGAPPHQPAVQQPEPAPAMRDPDPATAPEER